MFTGRGSERKLVDGKALTTGVLDARAGSAGETQGSHLQRRNLGGADVIGDGANKDGDLVFPALHHVG